MNEISIQFSDQRLVCPAIEHGPRGLPFSSKRRSLFCHLQRRETCGPHPHAFESHSKETHTSKHNVNLKFLNTIKVKKSALKFAYC